MNIPGIFEAPEYQEETAKKHVASWCIAHFWGVRAIFHALRIERRLGHLPKMESGQPLELSEPAELQQHPPGFYILRGFRQHRWPK
jgi:hypothetical protein